MIFYRRAAAGGSWRAACCFWLFSSLSSGFKIWIWIFMIENNRGYKNKSPQSWAVSYRGKQCLPHQSSLEMLASALIPVKADGSSVQPIAERTCMIQKCHSLLLASRILLLLFFKLKLCGLFSCIHPENQRKQTCHQGEIAWLVSNVVSLVLRVKQVTVFVSDSWISPLVST